MYSLAEELDRFAFSCFVAHDAIQPSRQWQEVIELALRTCDVLVAYVTPDFASSAWTDQEVGWALGRGSIVIPVRVGADPHGFFGAYQAVSWKEGDRAPVTAAAIARAIAVAVFTHQRRGAARLIRPMSDAIIDAFCLSRSFDATRRRFELLKLLPNSAWSEERVAKIETAIVENRQIREGVIERGPPIPEAVRGLIAKARA